MVKWYVVAEVALGVMLILSGGIFIIFGLELMEPNKYPTSPDQ